MRWSTVRSARESPSTKPLPKRFLSGSTPGSVLIRCLSYSLIGTFGMKASDVSREGDWRTIKQTLCAARDGKPDRNDFLFSHGSITRNSYQVIYLLRGTSISGVGWVFLLSTFEYLSVKGDKENGYSKTWAVYTSEIRRSIEDSRQSLSHLGFAAVRVYYWPHI